MGARLYRSWGQGWSAPAFLALVLMGLLAAFPWFGEVRNANEMPRLAQARALVEHGRWDLEAPSVATWDLGPDTARGEDGRVYPNKPPGSTLPIAAAYLTGRTAAELSGAEFTLRRFGWWARLFIGVLPTLAVCGIAMYRYRRDLGPPAVVAAAYVWVFGTPAFAYAHLAYGHALAAALMFFGVGQIADGHRQARPGAVALGATAAACAVTVEYGAVFAGIPIAWLLISGALRDDRGLLRALWGLGAALAPIAALATYQRTVFGSYFATGYQRALDPGFAAKHAEGLLGLGAPTWERFFTDWLALDTGLLCWSPVLVCGLFGLAQLAVSGHERRNEARIHLAIVGIMAVVGAGLNFEGGWRVGPRYLVFTLPGLVLGLGHFVNQIRTHTTFITVFVALTAYSVINNVLAGTLWPHIDPTHVANPFGELLWPLASDGVHPYGALELFGVPYPWVLSFGIPAAGLVLVVTRCVEFDVVVGWGALAAIGCAVAVFAMVSEFVEPPPRSEANLDYVRRVYEPRDDPERSAPPSRVLRHSRRGAGGG